MAQPETKQKVLINKGFTRKDLRVANIEIQSLISLQSDISSVFESTNFGFIYLYSDACNVLRWLFEDGKDKQKMCTQANFSFSFSFIVAENRSIYKPASAKN